MLLRGGWEAWDKNVGPVGSVGNDVQQSSGGRDGTINEAEVLKKKAENRRAAVVPGRNGYDGSLVQNGVTSVSLSMAVTSRRRAYLPRRLSRLRKPSHTTRPPPHSRTIPSLFRTGTDSRLRGWSLLDSRCLRWRLKSPGTEVSRIGTPSSLCRRRHLNSRLSTAPMPLRSLTNPRLPLRGHGAICTSIPTRGQEVLVAAAPTSHNRRSTTYDLPSTILKSALGRRLPSIRLCDHTGPRRHLPPVSPSFRRCRSLDHQSQSLRRCGRILPSRACISLLIRRPIPSSRRQA